jgi:DNA-binding transcriptional LysR family regulator
MKQNFTVRQGALEGVEAFLSVAQHRSFRCAAVGLGVTPCAISQAVRTREARVGAALFIRTTRSVGLTEAGERFRAQSPPLRSSSRQAGPRVNSVNGRPGDCASLCRALWCRSCWSR